MRKSELIDLYILEILGRRASEQKKMTQADLIYWLEEDYGVLVTRNTISSYLSALRDQKYIAGERGVYRVNKFNDHELRLLIDGVLFGQHIPAGDAGILIDKLKGMSELGLKDRIKNIYYLEGINRTTNNKLYEMIDTIDEAIQKKKQIHVEQCRYNTDKKLVRTGREFVMDPYRLVTEKSRYYLICYVNDDGSGHHGKGLENHRIDRFWSVELLDTPSRDMSEVPGYESRPFELDQYMKEHIYMWSGNSERVTLRIKAYNIGDFIDWFGTDFHVLEQDEKYMKVSILVNTNAITFWALQYGGMATVLAPDDVRENIKNKLAMMQENYKD